METRIIQLQLKVIRSGILVLSIDQTSNFRLSSEPTRKFERSSLPVGLMSDLGAIEMLNVMATKSIYCDTLANYAVSL